MANSSFQGILSLNDVRIRQNNNNWPLADTVVTVNDAGNQFYSFVIDTQRQYVDQFLYYTLNSVDDNSISAADFQDNAVQGQLYFNLSGTTTFTKKLLSLPNILKRFNLQLRTGNVSGPTVFTSSNISIGGTSSVRVFNSVEFLIVAGGAGASGGIGGGGGGGGVIIGTAPISRGTQYNIAVGAGGASTGYSSFSPNGSNSSAFGALAYGGGGAGVHDSTDGAAGGSGGGASSNNLRLNTGGAAIPSIVGVGNTGVAYGNRGGNMTVGRSGGPTKGAGGGGAGGQGVDTNPNSTGDNGQVGDGAGGPGIQSAILGTNYYWAGGGGGGAHTSGCGGYGGLGGGGGGGGEGSPANGAGGGSALNAGGGGGNPGGSGGTNTGGGGGSSHWQYTSGGAGGSGIVVVRYPDYFPAATAASNGSPTITLVDGYRIYRYTQSGSITF